MQSEKFMIRCDMEGVTGVVSYSQVEPGLPEYAAAREVFMREILALIEGLREGGAGEIVIYDEHWFGANLEVDRLPPGVKAICGKPPYRKDDAGGLDSFFSGVILHGLHSMAGTGEVLHHTYEPDILSLELNGTLVGEIGMETAIAGDFGVPVVLITADSAGVEEARRLIPGIAAVAVKKSLGFAAAESRPLPKVIEEIRDAARTIACSKSVVEPLKMVPPFKLAVELREGPYLQAVCRRAPQLMKTPTRLELEGRDNVTELWERYWLLKLKCLEDVAREGVHA